MQIHIGRVERLDATLKQRNPGLIEITGSTSGGDLANSIAVYARPDQVEALIEELTAAMAALKSVNKPQGGHRGTG